MRLRVGLIFLVLHFGLVYADKRSRHANLAHRKRDPPPPAVNASSSSPPSSSPPPAVNTPPKATTTSPAPPPPAQQPPPSSSQPPSAGQPAPNAPPAPAGQPGSSVYPTGAASGKPATPTIAAGPTTSLPSVSLASTPSPTATGIPQLSQITSGMPSQPTDSLTATFQPGATGPVPGAPPLPSAFVYNAADWPVQDHVPDTSSNEVQEWLTELDGIDIPGISPTADGSCVGDPNAASQAASRGWWTCGGYVRATDITACPDKMTWGVSFDDGPSAYTQTLLNYLNAKSLHATFFVVGSRVIERPQVLIEEYMSGNEISVHTWSHRPLTSLTTPQVVAELGWTRKAIKHVVGVTPTTMRPPYGDIDDRVRAIAMAMGMTPIIWTRTPSGGVFDTNDWRVAAGQVSGLQSYATFQTILNNATQLDNGFIVLQHDLFAITVDLAVGYTLDAALTHNPSFNLEPIGKCAKIPTTDLYMETTKNKTFPYANHTYDIDGESTPGSSSSSSAPGVVKIGSNNSDSNSNAAPIVSIPIFTAIWFVALAAFSSFL